MSEALYASVLILAIITGLFVVASIVSVIFAIIEFGWRFGQNYWAPLLLLALFAWMVRSNSKATSPNTSVPHQSPSASGNHRQRRSSHPRSLPKTQRPPSIPKTQNQSIQKKKDPRPQSPAVSNNKLAFLQQQKVKQGRC